MPRRVEPWRQSRHCAAQPSCLTSWTQSRPSGTAGPRAARRGSINPAGRCTGEGNASEKLEPKLCRWCLLSAFCISGAGKAGRQWLRHKNTVDWLLMLTSAGAAPALWLGADRDAAAQVRPARGCCPYCGRRRPDLQRMRDVVGDRFSQVTPRGGTMALDRDLRGLRNANQLGAESAMKDPLRDNLGGVRRIDHRDQER